MTNGCIFALRTKPPNHGERRNRVLAIVAGILGACHLKTAEDLFGKPQGSARTDPMIAAAVQWAEGIMLKIDGAYSK